MMSPQEHVVWEPLDDHTDRLTVPGGWLYRLQRYGQAVALEFVPFPQPNPLGGLGGGHISQYAGSYYGQGTCRCPH